MKISIEQRVQQMEDIHEIARIKANYCKAADCGWDRPGRDAAIIASLFVEDGVWDAGSFGRADGREAIHALFSENPYPFGLHRVSNQNIYVNGDTATGEWHLLCPSIVGENQSIWIGGMYNDEFIRTSDGWKFKKLKVTIAFTSKSEPGFEVVKTIGI